MSNAKEAAEKIFKALWPKEECGEYMYEVAVPIITAAIEEAVDAETVRAGLIMEKATREIGEQVRKEERERCAKIAEGDWQCESDKCSHNDSGECIAQKIRSGE